MAARRQGAGRRFELGRTGRLMLALAASASLHAAAAGIPWSLTRPAKPPGRTLSPLYMVELQPWVESPPSLAKPDPVFALREFRRRGVRRARSVERALLAATRVLVERHRLVELQERELAALAQERARLAQEKETLAGLLSQEKETGLAREQALAAREAELASAAEARTRLQSIVRELEERLARRESRTRVLEAEIGAYRRQKEDELLGVKEAYDRLVEELRSDIAEKNVTLRRVKERLTVTILDRVLFPSGQATLTPEGRRVLAKVAAVLVRVKDRKVQIEGHTDNVPIGPALRQTFASNWELSTARATEVVKYLIGEGGVAPARLIAVGRADTVPVALNSTEEGRRQNRRIEVVLLPPTRPPEEPRKAASP